MRLIKRQYTVTDYQVLESTKDGVKELSHIIMEGEADVQKVRKEILKRFPDNNAFVGEMNTTTAVYSMTAEKFLELAEKDVLNELLQDK